MTEKMQQAIDKIDREMEKNQSLKFFAQFITDNLNVSDEAAEKILDDKKSLSGCFSFARNKANGCAFGSDDDLLDWICEYFGITYPAKERKPLNGLISFLRSKSKELSLHENSLVDYKMVYSWCREYFGSTQTESNIIDFDIFADL